MTDHDRDEFPGDLPLGEDREPAYDDDPVARFFSEHRAAVRPEPADDLDWARISRASRRRLPGSFLLGAVVAAAVAVIAGFGVWTVQSPKSTAPINAAAQTSSVTKPADQSGPQSPSSVPDRFVTWSLSSGGGKTVFNLGAGSCGDATCPVLLRTQNNGSSWVALHTFDTTLGAQVRPGSSRINPDDQLRDVRFVTPEIGYVFGGDLWVTRDAGATFTRVEHSGRTILDVEAQQGDLLVVTGDECGSGTCTGSIRVTRMDTAADVVPVTASAVADVQIPISSAQLVVNGGVVYVSLVAAADRSNLAPLRLKDGSLDQLSAAQACSGTTLQALTPALGNDRHLFALCEPVVRSSSTTYTLVKSADDGVSWSAVSKGAVRLPTGVRVTLASTDDTHVTAAAGVASDADPGTGIGPGTLSVSTDGGLTFTAKDGRLGLPPTGIDWIASPGRNQYYAISLSGSNYWWTTDYGQTWQAIDPLG